MQIHIGLIHLLNSDFLCWLNLIIYIVKSSGNYAEVDQGLILIWQQAC